MAQSSNRIQRGFLGVAVMDAWDRDHPTQLSGTFIASDVVIDLNDSDEGMSVCSPNSSVMLTRATAEMQAPKASPAARSQTVKRPRGTDAESSGSSKRHRTAESPLNPSLSLSSPSSVNSLLPQFNRGLSLTPATKMDQAVRMRALRVEISQAVKQANLKVQHSVALTASVERTFINSLYDGARKIIPTLPPAYD